MTKNAHLIIGPFKRINFFSNRFSNIMERTEKKFKNRFLYGQSNPAGIGDEESKWIKK